MPMCRMCLLDKEDAMPTAVDNFLPELLLRFTGVNIMGNSENMICQSCHNYLMRFRYEMMCLAFNFLDLLGQQAEINHIRPDYVINNTNAENRPADPQPTPEPNNPTTTSQQEPEMSLADAIIQFFIYYHFM